MANFLKNLTIRYRNHKSKRKHRLLSLPSHILAIILKNLDFSTLNSNQDDFADALAEVSSLSLSLPPSSFLPEGSTSYYGKFSNYMYNKLLEYLFYKEESFSTNKLYKFVFRHLLWLHKPRIRDSSNRLFQRLTNLESLELELTPTTSVNNRLSVLSDPSFWLRWDANLGTSKPDHDYILYVFGDVVAQQDDFTLEDIIPNRFLHLRKYWTLHYHASYHMCTLMSLLHKRGNNVDVLKTVGVIAEKKGRMKFGPNCIHRCKYGFRNCRYIVYYLPGVLTLDNSSGSSSSILIKDIYLYFYVDDCKGEDGDGDNDASADDYIRAYLRNVDEDDKNNELTEVLKKLLVDNRRILLHDD